MEVIFLIKNGRFIKPINNQITNIPITYIDEEQGRELAKVFLDKLERDGIISSFLSYDILNNYKDYNEVCLIFELDYTFIFIEKKNGKSSFKLFQNKEIVRLNYGIDFNEALNDFLEIINKKESYQVKVSMDPIYLNVGYVENKEEAAEETKKLIRDIFFEKGIIVSKIDVEIP